MAQIIDMPKLSDTMTVGTLVNWLKRTGDAVKSGEKVAEIETDKATMELESFDDGVILATYVEAGAQVEVGAPIYAVGKAGEKAPAAPKVAAPAAAPAAEPAPAPKVEEPKAAPAPIAAPAAPAPAPVAEKPAAATAPAAEGARTRSSPLARKVAAAKGVDIAGLTGTGPFGRIVRSDVENAPAAPAAAPAAAAAPAPTTSAAAAPAVAALADRTVPVSTMRGIIAKRLLESKTTVPHFYLEMEVDAAPLADLRASLNAALADLPPAQGGVKVSVNDLILKASAEALRRVPAVNTSWQGDKIAWHGSVHLAFGVALEDGLVTPVIRNAESKSLRQIAREAKDLATRARSKKLKPDEMSGSTFTVTNLGMFGISSFYGIINPPNAAILSVGATIAKPVVNAKGEIVAGQRMTIGLSGDHRVVDGAVAAQFLAALRDLLESPAAILV